MGMLAAPWFLAVVGLLSSLVVGVMMMFSAQKKIVATPPPIAAAVVVEEKPVPPQTVFSFHTAELVEMVEDLKKQKQKILEEQKDVKALAARTLSDRQEVEKIRDEIKELRADLDRRVVEVQQEEVKNLEALASTYSAMPAPAAVSIFKEMEEDQVVKILATMKAKAVALVLSEMGKAIDKTGEESTARRAARITDKLRLMKNLKKEVAQ
jgi:flagellar motility protein MotE (MotC chaperone)